MTRYFKLLSLGPSSQYNCSQFSYTMTISLYVHKGGLKPDSFHFIYTMTNGTFNKHIVQDMCILLTSKHPFFHALIFNMFNGKNNLQALFHFVIKLIRHTVKTSYFCEVIFDQKQNLLRFEKKMVDYTREFMCYSLLVNTCRNSMPYVGPMLVHRLRSWPNIGPTLGALVSGKGFALKTRTILNKWWFCQLFL